MIVNYTFVGLKSSNKRSDVKDEQGVKMASGIPTDYQGGDNTTKILIGIVIVFSSSHFLRLFLQCYHHIAANNYRECVNNGVKQKEIPYWLWPLTAINHTLLVLNSSINFVLYCWLGSSFRSSLIKETKKLLKKIGCFKNTPITTQLSTSKGNNNSIPTILISKIIFVTILI